MNWKRCFIFCSLRQSYLISHELVLFWVMFLLIKFSVVVLSIINVVAGWGWPICAKIYCIGIACCVLWNTAAVSLSAAEVTTCLSVLHSTKIGAFWLVGCIGVCRKKNPTIRLLAFGATRKAASEWTFYVVLVAW